MITHLNIVNPDYATLSLQAGYKRNKALPKIIPKLRSFVCTNKSINKIFVLISRVNTSPEYDHSMRAESHVIAGL